jgi:hypothetical protein
MKEDLSDFFNVVSEEMKKQEEWNSHFKPPDFSNDINFLVESISKVDLFKTQPKKKIKKVKKVISPVVEQKNETEILIDTSINFINEEIKKQSPKPQKDQNSEIKHLKDLVYKLVRDVSAQGGGGEVNLAYMDVPLKYVTSSSYNITLNDYYIGVNYSGAVTITLPVADKPGRIFIVKDELGEASKGTNRYITILPSGSDLIDGKDRAILAYDYGSLTFIYRNGWRVV